jgi:hypothetical protein
MCVGLCKSLQAEYQVRYSAKFCSIYSSFFVSLPIVIERMKDIRLPKLAHTTVSMLMKSWVSPQTE